MNKHKAKYQEQGSVRVIVAWFLVILIAAGGIFGVYAWQHHKVVDLQATANSLRLDIAKLKNQKPSNQPANSSSTSSYTSKQGTKVILFVPKSGTKVSSPLAVVGEVPGNWSFEASFPVKLNDSSGNEVASGTAQLLGDWMTDQLVPFSVKLTYTSTPTGNGELVLQKDNPSGLEKNDDSVAIPVKF